MFDFNSYNSIQLKLLGEKTVDAMDTRGLILNSVIEEDEDFDDDDDEVVEVDISALGSSSIEVKNEEEKSSEGALNLFVMICEGSTGSCS